MSGMESTSTSVPQLCVFGPAGRRISGAKPLSRWKGDVDLIFLKCRWISRLCFRGVFLLFLCLDLGADCKEGGRGETDSGRSGLSSLLSTIALPFKCCSMDEKNSLLVSPVPRQFKGFVVVSSFCCIVGAKSGLLFAAFASRARILDGPWPGIARCLETVSWFDSVMLLSATREQLNG